MKILQYSIYIPKESILTRNCFLYGLDSNKNFCLRGVALVTATTLSFFNAIYYITDFFSGRSLAENLKKTQHSLVFTSILFTYTISGLDKPHFASKIMKIAQEHLSKSQTLFLAKTLTRSEQPANLATALGGLPADQAVNLTSALTSLHTNEALNLFKVFASLSPGKARNLTRTLANLNGNQNRNLTTALATIPINQGVNGASVLANLHADEALNVATALATFPCLITPLANLPTKEAMNLARTLGCPNEWIIRDLSTKIESLSIEEALTFIIIIARVSNTKIACYLIETLKYLPQYKILILTEIFSRLSEKQVIFLTLTLGRMYYMYALDLIEIFVNSLEEEAFCLATTLAANYEANLQINGYPVLAITIATVSRDPFHLLAFDLIKIFRSFSEKERLHIATIFEELLENKAMLLARALIKTLPLDLALPLVKTLVNLQKKESVSLARIVVKASEEEVCRLAQICETFPTDLAFRLASG